MSLTKIVLTNETAVERNKEKQKSKDRVKKGHFNKIAEGIHLLRKIDANATISKAMIDCRIQRGNLILLSTLCGKLCPLTSCEDFFVDMTIKISRCRHSIASGEGLQLINPLAKNKVIEENMK